MWPPHLLRTRELLLEAMRILGLHGHIRLRTRRDLMREVHVIVVTIEVARDHEPSPRDLRRQRDRERS